VFAFFSFQGAQAVGMGKEAINVRAAAELFDKANDILGYLQKLGYDLLVCAHK
jgi:[acyl-carrier-protein] S-malonyltransferase